MTVMDLCCLLFILFTIKLSGTQDTQGTQVLRKISVQRGQSILIPFLYKQKNSHSNSFLSAECYTIQGYNLKTVFFSDDKPYQIFTVRIDNVQESGDYLCAVQTPSGFEYQARFSLEVTADYSRLHVNNQNLIGSENESITVNCYHHRQVNDVKWCKFGGRCMTGTSGSFDGASVEMRYSSGLMVVTMSKLKKENTGWYWCQSGDLQMPVHITVKQKMTLTATELSVTTESQRSTAVLFLLPATLEVLLLIIIYAALKLFKLCRERRLQSRNQEAEDTQYVVMHRKRSSHSAGCATVNDETYERMTGLKSNIELLPFTGVKSTCVAVVKQSHSPNVPQKEPEYENITNT